jgi:ribosomal protein S18 acetylase RimI-like enzyme
VNQPTAADLPEETERVSTPSAWSPAGAPGKREAASPDPAQHPVIRPATRADLPELRRLVLELATYERAPEQVAASVEDFERALFGDPAWAHALVAGESRALRGMALYYRTFSTWTGRPGIHLEDLFVEPPARGRGIGRALLVTLAAECRRDGLPRLDWDVLAWNTSAVEFYRSLGATEQEEWRGYRLSGEALEALAVEHDPPGGRSAQGAH